MHQILCKGDAAQEVPNVRVYNKKKNAKYLNDYKINFV